MRIFLNNYIFCSTFWKKSPKCIYWTVPSMFFNISIVIATEIEHLYVSKANTLYKCILNSSFQIQDICYLTRVIFKLLDLKMQVQTLKFLCGIEVKILTNNKQIGGYFEIQDGHFLKTITQHINYPQNTHKNKVFLTQVGV